MRDACKGRWLSRFLRNDGLLERQITVHWEYHPLETLNRERRNMGQQSKKLTDFFGGRRRSCMLIQSVLLKSKGNEKRMKLTVSMPLSGTNLTNAPEPFLTQFMVCEKEDSASNHAAIDVQFDSMAASIYSTDDIVNPTVLSHGALLHRFAMIGKGTGDKRTVS